MIHLGEYYHFRCHTDELDRDALVTYLCDECDVLCIVAEQGTRPHIHSTLKFKVNKDTAISRLQKKFPIKGNGNYSCKSVRKFEENLQYCYKGTAADYADVLFSVHTEAEIKEYYKKYWVIQGKILSDLKTRKQKKTIIENDSSGNEIVTTIRKVRTRTFMEKLRDAVCSEHEPLVKSIWYHEANLANIKVEYVPVNNLEYCQNYLYNFFKKSLGKSVKNIDDFILERMFRGLYSSICEECPVHITHKKNVSELEKFRHKL